MISPADPTLSAPAAPPVRGTQSPDRHYDAGLVRRFHGGDATAFDEMVARHRRPVFALALSHLRNRADAEEIVQDTFIRAHRGLATFRGDASLATWLHCIALNLSRNRYWYFFRRRRHLTASLDQTCGDRGPATLGDLIATEAADPAQEMATADFTELVVRCVARLSEPSREILRLRNTLHHSYAEIAAELGLCSGTVKSRIARAREGLRLLIAGAGPEFAATAGTAAWFVPARIGGLRVACA